VAQNWKPFYPSKNTMLTSIKFFLSPTQKLNVLRSLSQTTAEKAVDFNISVGKSTAIFTVAHFPLKGI